MIDPTSAPTPQPPVPTVVISTHSTSPSKNFCILGQILNNLLNSSFKILLVKPRLMQDSSSIFDLKIFKVKALS